MSQYPYSTRKKMELQQLHVNSSFCLLKANHLFHFRQVYFTYLSFNFIIQKSLFQKCQCILSRIIIDIKRHQNAFKKSSILGLNHMIHQHPGERTFNWKLHEELTRLAIYHIANKRPQTFVNMEKPNNRPLNKNS